LANNSFSSIIGNYSFGSIKGLQSLNLSLNNFESIEDEAFMYWYIGENVIHNYPLPLVDLDLSKNSFESINWESIKKLKQLDRLWLNNNPLKSLDYSIVNQDKSLKSGITQLYANDCLIEYINPLFLAMFRRLKILDLHNNKIKHLSYQIPTYLDINNSFELLIVHNNPLVCDCRIRWLTIFLRKNKNKQLIHQNIHKYPPPTCRHEDYNNDDFNDDQLEIADTHDISIQTDQIQYDNNEVTSTTNDTIQHISPSIMTTKREQPLLDIFQLVDSDFMCELQLNSSKVFQTDSNNLILECEVKTYPAANIWWTYGERVFGKIYDNTGDVPNYEIKEFPIKKQLSSSKGDSFNDDTFTFKTQLHITNFRSQYSGKFYCRTMHQLNNQNSKTIRNTKKAVVFNIQLLYANGEPIPIENHYKQAQPAPQIRHGDINNNNSPFIYWLMLAICITFSLTVIIFVACCIMRNNNRYKKDESIYMSSSSSFNTNNKRYCPNSTPYYSIVGSGPNNNGMYSKNNSTFSSSSTNSAYTQPLKPDVIREHRESSSPTYTNLNLSSPSRNSTPYSNLTFKTNTTKLQSTSLDDDDCDNDQIQSSLIEDNDDKDVSMSLSRSFEENFEAYQDPKFDDLRKPTKYTNSTQKYS
jgi:hypothetical protein